MKLHPIILFLILIQFSCQKENSELEGSWILVKNEVKPNAGFIPVLRGQLFHFDKDKFYISYPPSNEEIVENYFLDGEYIKTDSTTFGKILHLSRDSLIIEADTNSFDMHLRPLEEITFTREEKNQISELLINNPWEIYDSNLETNYKLYCNEKEWGEKYEGNKWTKHIVYEQQFKNEKWLSEYELWTLKEFKGSLIFFFTSALRMESAQFQIANFNKETISGKFMNWYGNNWVENDLSIVVNKSEKELNFQKELIRGNWQTNKLISPTEKEIEYLRDSFDMSGVGVVRFQNRILLSDLASRNLKIQLSSNGNYKVLAGNKVIRKGTAWGITKDAGYLFFDSDLVGENLFEIKSIGENQFITNFRVKIGLPREHRYAFAFVNLEVELKKENNME